MSAPILRLLGGFASCQLSTGKVQFDCKAVSCSLALCPKGTGHRLPTPVCDLRTDRIGDKFRCHALDSRHRPMFTLAGHRIV